MNSGARGFGEIKQHFAIDSPEARRGADLAAELGVPILIHFQEVDHVENEGAWSSEFATKFEALLQASPKTTFIATRLAGKCVARETLTVLQRSATADVLRKIAWDNAHRVLKLSRA